MTPEPTKTASETGPLGVDDLKKLPSKRTYTQFDGGVSSYSAFCSWLDDTKTTVKSKLEDYENVNGYADNIVNAWCNAYAQGSGTFSYTNTYCTPFYYWLGDILIDNLADGQSFLDIMKIIYTELGATHGGGIADAGNGCGIIYNDIDKGLFKHAKILYEYDQDRIQIEEQLQNSNKQCTAEYKSHLDNIVSACGDVEEGCPGEGRYKGQKYCGQFNARAKGGDADYCSTEKLKILTCTQVSHTEMQPTGLTADHGHQAHSLPGEAQATSPGTSTIPAISGILAAIGLPAIATFFLYKYNLLPSWINDSFRMNKAGGGRSNRRKGRSTKTSTGRHKIDDDDISTIEYSSEYSIPYTSSSSGR